MDEQYLIAAARYIEQNPVRARMVKRAKDYRWSSARAHIRGKDDGLVKVGPLIGIISDWKEFLRSEEEETMGKALRLHSRTGRPLGEPSFVKRLERLLHRNLRREKPGPKPRGQKR